jgi:hypothetical protein
MTCLDPTQTWRPESNLLIALLTNWLTKLLHGEEPRNNFMSLRKINDPVNAKQKFNYGYQKKSPLISMLSFQAAARSKGWVCCSSVVGIANSNQGGFMEFCLFSLFFISASG